MKAPTPPTPSARSGFTLVEAMLAIALFVAVTAGSWGLFLTMQRNWFAASLAMETSTEAGSTLQRIVYGDAGLVEGIRHVSTVTRNDISGGGWELVFDGTNNLNRIIYDPANRRIVHANGYVYCSHVLNAAATNDADGVSIDVTVERVVSGLTNSASMSTSIRFRNE